MPRAPSRKLLGRLVKALISPGLLWAYLYWVAIGAALFCLGWGHGYRAGTGW